MLQINNVVVRYGKETVVNGLNLHLTRGDIGCLIGPSGCGKTTLLRAIAGFEPVAAGEIRLGDEKISASDFTLAPERRRIGMVFQDFALFPHLTVAANIGFGLPRQNKQERQERVEKLLALIGLQEYANDYPHQLSGGQQQRVALARALAPRPRILLMDEPFSNLDPELREVLAREVRKILKQEGISALMVTHDQFEAFTMGDFLGVMRDGQLEQWGSAYALYHEPASRFVADFIGRGTMVAGTVRDPEHVSTALATLKSDAALAYPPGTQVDIFVRPDDIIHDDTSPLTAEIVEKAFRGPHILYTLRTPSAERILCLAPSHHDHHIGERMGIRLDVDHLVVFPRKV